MEDFKLEELGLFEEQEKPKVLTEKQIKENRFNRMNAIFERKIKGIKRLGIDVPEIKGTAIDAQKECYDAMYSSALKGAYDDETNNAIIQAHEEAELLVAQLVLLANVVRKILTYHINNATNECDELLDYADSIKMTRDDMTDEYIQEIKDKFDIGD